MSPEVSLPLSAVAAGGDIASHAQGSALRDCAAALPVSMMSATAVALD
jgi:hypothetical protein